MCSLLTYIIEDTDGSKPALPRVKVWPQLCRGNSIRAEQAVPRLLLSTCGGRDKHIPVYMFNLLLHLAQRSTALIMLFYTEEVSLQRHLKIHAALFRVIRQILLATYYYLLRCEKVGARFIIYLARIRQYNAVSAQNTHEDRTDEKNTEVTTIIIIMRTRYLVSTRQYQQYQDTIHVQVSEINIFIKRNAFIHAMVISSFSTVTSKRFVFHLEINDTRPVPDPQQSSLHHLLSEVSFSYTFIRGPLCHTTEHSSTNEPKNIRTFKLFVCPDMR